MTEQKPKSKLLFKIFFHFVSIIIVFIILLTMAIGTMYKSFVIYGKEHQIIKIYNSLKDKTIDGILAVVDDFNFNHNIWVYVVDNELNDLGNSRMMPQKMMFRDMRRIIQENSNELESKQYLFAKNKSDKKPPDTMTFIGKLNNGGYFVAMLSYSFVNENIGYSIKFILLFSILAIVLCGVVSYILAKRISSPIINISEITRKMSHLDFSEKCNVNSNDELETLANNVNFLSEELEQNINELRCEIIKERKIDEMRKNLIINVSHELKTPIFLIQSYAEGLIENVSCNDKDRNYYCHVIEDEAKRMDTMVRELLNLAKIEAGKEELNIIEFNLSTLVGDVLKNHCITLRNKNIKLCNDVESSAVIGDIKLIRNAFSNLLINAIDYSPQNGLIKIRSEVKKDSVFLYVYNYGSHIKEDENDKIWQSFYKVDKSRTRGYGGTGMGLSIVKAVMDSHNTSYGVLNTDNGVEFYIELKRP